MAVGQQQQFTTKLTVDGTGFLSLLQQALTQGVKLITDFMVRAGSVKISVDVNTAPAEKSLDNLEQHAEKTGGILSKIGGVGGGLGLTAIAAGVGVVAKAMIDGNAEMEQYNTAFEVLTGSVDNAKSLMGDLKNFAQATPFEFPQLAKATQTLLAFGIQQKDILPTLKNLGDVSGGNAEKLQSLATVFGQISANGKLTGGDLLQMINVGFNPLKVISEQTGKSVADLRKEMEKGQISAQMVTDAFKSATGAGGQFNGMMEKQALTFTGLKSTLQDVGGELLRTLGGPVFTVAKSTLTQILTLLQGPEIQSAVTSFGQLLGSLIGPLTSTITGLIGPLAKLIGPLIDLIVAAIAPIAGILTTLTSQVGSVIGTLASTVGAILGPVTQIITSVLTPLGGLVQQIVVLLGSTLQGVVEKMGAAWKTLLDVLAPLVPQILNPLVSLLQSALIPILNLLLGLWASIQGVVASLIGVLANLLKAILPPLMGVFGILSGILQTLLDAFLPIIKVLTEALNPILQIITPILQSFGNLLGTLITTALRIVTPILKVLAELLAVSATLLVGNNEQWGLLRGVIELIIPVLEGVLKVVGFVVEGIGSMLSSLTDFLGLTNTIEDKARKLHESNAAALSESAKKQKDQGEQSIKTFIEQARSVDDLNGHLKQTIDRFTELRDSNAQLAKDHPDHAEGFKEIAGVYDSLIAKANEAADARAKVLQGGTGPGTPAPTTPTAKPAEKIKDALDLSNRLVAIAKDTNARLSDIENKRITDSEDRRRNELKRKFDGEIAAQGLILSQLNKDLDAAKKDKKPLKLDILDDKGNVIRTLTDRNAIVTEFESRLAKQSNLIEQQRLQALAELEKTFAEERRKRQTEQLDEDIAELRKTQETITGTTAEEMQKRFRLEQEIQNLQRAKLTTDPERKQFDLETAEANAKRQKDIEVQAVRDKIAELPTVLQQETALKLLAIDQQLALDLQANKLNEAKKTELTRTAEAERLKIREDFLKQSSTAYQIMDGFRTLIEKTFTITINTEEQKRAAERHQAALKTKQEADEQRAAGVISLKEYNSKIAGIQNDLVQKEISGAEKVKRFILQAQQGLIDGLTSLANKFLAASQAAVDTYTATLQARNDRYTQLLKEKKTEQEAIQIASLEFEKSVAEQQSSIIGNSIVALGAKLGAMAADTHKNIGDFLKQTAVSILDFVASMIPLWSAAYLGGALATPQSIFSLGATAVASWAGITLLLEGIVAGARAGVLSLNNGISWVPGFDTGGDTVPAMIRPGERVTPRAQNIRYWDLLEAVRTDDPRAMAIQRAFREPTSFAYPITSNNAIVEQRFQAMESRLLHHESRIGKAVDHLEEISGRIAFVARDTQRTADATEKIASKKEPLPERETVL